MPKRPRIEGEGRPTKYDPSFIEKAKEYLSLNEDSTIKGKLKVKLPTHEGFAVFLGVNVDSLYEWAKLYPKFSEALRLIKTEQQQRLINKGLSNEYNSTIAKLILSANHGMRERQDVTSNDKDVVQPLLVKIIGDEKDNT